MEGRVKSHISNKTYTTDIEKLEEEDINETSELYMIPISGHKIMVAPGKSNMDEDEGIAFCYVYVIKKEKVLCKLGVYEKKTETMPLFFDISTFPEGSFCLFEEYEKNPSKLVDFEMSEPLETKSIQGQNPNVYGKNVYGKNVFDYLTGEFSKIPEKRERIKGAYKSLYETYKSLINVDKEKKNKKMESILRTISEAGKDPEPKDTFLETLKTNAQDKPVFVMTLLALQRVFLIDFTFVTDYESADEREEYKRMKEDWTISNATKELEVDMNTYTILDPNFVMKDTEDVIPEETELDLEVEESEPVIDVEEPEAEPEAEAEAATEYEPEAEKEPDTYSESVVETESEPLVSVKKSRKSTPKSDTAGPESVKKSRKSTPKSESETIKASKTESMTDVVESLKKPSSKASSKSGAKLITDYRAGIMPSTPEDEERLRTALVEMASESLMKKSKKGAESILAEAVSRVKKTTTVKDSTLSTTLSKKKENANKPSSTPTETKIKQTRTIPKIKKAIE